VLLERAGHDALMLDAHLCGLTQQQVADQVAAFAPAMTVVTTAPTYLFWRCAPPELRIPRGFLDALGRRGGRTVAIGPHGSATPEAALRKLGCDIVVRGESEEVLAALADAADPSRVPSVAFWDGGAARVNGAPAATRFTDLPALHWPAEWVARHTHHHHRFDSRPTCRARRSRPPAAAPTTAPSARRSTSATSTAAATWPSSRRDRRAARAGRGLPLLHRRDLPAPARAARGPGRPRPAVRHPDAHRPLEARHAGAARARRLRLDRGRRGEPDRGGRAALDKNCRMTTEELADRLLHARRFVPFVQANLIEMSGDDAALVEAWRAKLQAGGVWANDPVPLYPYPSSPDYRRSSASPTTSPGNAPMRTTWRSSPTSPTSRRNAPRARPRWRRRARRDGEPARPDDRRCGGRRLELCPRPRARPFDGGTRVTLAVLGPAPDAAQRAAAVALPDVALEETGLPLDWLATSRDEVLRRARRWRRWRRGSAPTSCSSTAPALAAAGFRVPVLGVCHSCLATWWQAVRDGEMPEDFRWRTEILAEGYRGRDALVAPSRAFSRATAAAYGLAPLVVHNGRRAGPRTLRAGAFAFTAGRLWDEGKDLATLDRAAARLSIPILAAGPTRGPNGAEVALPHLQVLGTLDEPAMRSWLARGPVFVSAARYEPVRSGGAGGGAGGLRPRPLRHPDLPGAVGWRRGLRAAGR
jgi:hypothetical protein